MMKFLSVLLLVIAISFLGCQTTGTDSGIGDGKVDAVETAVIRLAVGGAMTSMPETVVPAYAVSKALLVAMDGDNPIKLSLLSKAVEKKVDGLDLTVYEKQSVMDLVELVKAQIMDRIGGLDAGDRIVVVKAVIQIVHDAAGARLLQ